MTKETKKTIVCDCSKASDTSIKNVREVFDKCKCNIWKHAGGKTRVEKEYKVQNLSVFTGYN